jgi:hypothetical protein
MASSHLFVMRQALYGFVRAIFFKLKWIVHSLIIATQSDVFSQLPSGAAGLPPSFHRLLPIFEN